MLVEEPIIKKVLRGERNCYFNQLIEMYQPKVFSIAYRMMGNLYDAQDICQEVFIKAYLNITKLRQTSSFQSWLIHITKNCCYDELRSRRRKITEISLERTIENDYFTNTLTGNLPSPEEVAINKELKSTICTCINTLSKKHSKVIVLRELRGHSYEEISQIMGCSVGTVKSRLSNARNIIRGKLRLLDCKY